MKNIKLRWFKMSADDVLKSMASVLRASRYKNVKTCADYVYAAGSIPIMLTAHADTVHASLPRDIFYDRKMGALWSPDGLGADDRAGILAILELLRRGHRPHVLITTGEETGGVGVSVFVKQVKDTDVHYVIELDRKGAHDAVFYGCTNNDFKKYVCGFGFAEAEGIFSDISILCPCWNVAGVNLSCGYYNAHTFSEYMLLGELRKTINRVEKMLQSSTKHRFKHGHTSVSAKSKFDFDTKCSNESVYLWGTVNPRELSYIYGGTLNEWDAWLRENKDALQDAADEAVWRTVDMRIQQSGMRTV